MKAEMRDWLIEHFPKKGRVYCEPFAGRANVFFQMALVAKFDQWWLNDIRTADFIKALAHVHPNLIPASVTKRAAAAWKQRAVDGDITALALDAELTYCGIGFAQGGTVTAMASSPRSRIEKARILMNRTGPRVTSFDVLKVMEWPHWEAEDFVYFDPPYSAIDVGAYGTDDVNHERLLSRLAAAQYRWALSNYEDPLYVEALGPPTATLERRRRGLSANRGVTVRECLWVKEA
jgi:hypothetical protein